MPRARPRDGPKRDRRHDAGLRGGASCWSARDGDARPLRSSSSVEAGVREAIGWRPQTVGPSDVAHRGDERDRKAGLSRDGVRRSPEYVEVRRVLRTILVARATCCRGCPTKQQSCACLGPIEKRFARRHGGLAEALGVVRAAVDTSLLRLVTPTDRPDTPHHTHHDHHEKHRTRAAGLGGQPR